MSVVWSTEKRQALRYRLPSVIELIDRRDPAPTFYEFAELPARADLKVRTPEAGISDHLAFSKLPRWSRISSWILLVVMAAAGVAFWMAFFMEASK